MNIQKAAYKIDKKNPLNFEIENYSCARPFSSFFPGVAGLKGIPLWCFYVNRGQGISSFGIKDKDGAIMEFHPANKAYRLTSIHGFRTFIKLSNRTKTELYQPFIERAESDTFEIKNKMIISPYDLTIEETNEKLGLKVQIKYFTITNEPLAVLVRKVTIINLNEHDLDVELLDGIPIINFHGMDNAVMKNMSRTIEAWAFVDNMDNKVPYYRLKCSSADGVEVKEISEGNFYCGFIESNSGKVMLTPIIDPNLVFGHVSDMTFPYEFLNGSIDCEKPQGYTNRTCCAFSHAKLLLKGKGSEVVYSVIGHAKSLENTNKNILI